MFRRHQQAQNRSMAMRVLSFAGVGIVALAASVTAASPAQAAIGIQVAPSPNGYVMKGVATSITATGFSGNAKAYRFDADAKQWRLIGAVTKASAIPYVFQQSGPTRIRIVPTTGKAVTTTVGVYDRFAFQPCCSGGEPTNYGGLVLPSSADGYDKATMTADKGCVLADIGGHGNYGKTGLALRVSSYGSPEVTLPLPDAADQGASMTSIPVTGDAVVEPLGGAFTGITWGVVWTCLNG